MKEENSVIFLLRWIGNPDAEEDFDADICEVDLQCFLEEKGVKNFLQD